MDGIEVEKHSELTVKILAAYTCIKSVLFVSDVYPAFFFFFFSLCNLLFNVREWIIAAVYLTKLIASLSWLEFNSSISS